MFSRVLCVLTLAGVVAVAGCSRMVGGAAVTRYDKGKEAVMAEATADGQYALYSTYDATPLATYNLSRGDKLGFERGDAGKVVAVAGSNRLTLEDKSYIWKKRN
jgi:hypothetical protein